MAAWQNDAQTGTAARRVEWIKVEELVAFESTWCSTGQYTIPRHTPCVRKCMVLTCETLLCQIEPLEA